MGDNCIFIENDQTTRLAEELIKTNQESVEANELEKEVSEEVVTTISNVLTQYVNRIYQPENPNEEIPDKSLFSWLNNILSLECDTKEGYKKALERYNNFYKEARNPDAKYQLDDDEIRFITVDSANPKETAAELRAMFGDVLYIANTERYKGKISIIVRKPIDMSGRKQESSLRRLKTLSSIKPVYLETEILHTDDDDPKKGKTEWRFLEFNEPLKKGEKKTGRVKYRYAGREIISTATTFSDDDKKYPVLSGPLGDAFDVAGRLFFNEDSGLYLEGELDLDGNSSDVLLAGIIEKNLFNAYTLTGLKNLLRDFEKLKEQLLKKWPNAKFFTDPISLFGKNENGEWTMGKPDLIVVKEDGSLAVVDFKTMNIKTDIDKYNQPLVGDEFSRDIKYGDQTTRYINMLQYSYGFDTEKRGYIVLGDVWYISADKGEGSERRYYEKVDKQLKIDPSGDFKKENMQPLSQYAEDYRENNEILEEDEDVRNALQKDNDIILYIEPRLHVVRDVKTGYSEELAALREGEDVPFNTSLSTYEEEFQNLGKSDKLDLYDFAGAVQIYERGQGVFRLPTSHIDSRPDIIGPDETQYLADELAIRISTTIDQLQEGKSFRFKDSREKILGESRRAVIMTIGLRNLIDSEFDSMFTPEKDFPQLTREDFKDGAYDDYENSGYYWDSWEDYVKERSNNNKKIWIASHKPQFLNRTATKLMHIERCIVPRVNNAPQSNALENPMPDLMITDPTESIEVETGNNESNENFFDTYSEGLSDLERWMMQLRNFSPKLSLAQEVAQLFEKLYMYDNDGNLMTDPYGYGFALRMNSTTAIQTLFDRIYRCDTWKEMESEMIKMAAIPKNKWINDILKRLQGEQNHDLRARFFSNFRRDALLYTRSRVRMNPKTGDREVITQVINLKTAQDALIQELGADFKAGRVGKLSIDGKDYSLITADKNGKMQLSSIVSTELRNLYKDINYTLSQIYEDFRKKFRGSPNIDEERTKYVVAELENRGIISKLTKLIQGYGIMITEDMVSDYCTVNVAKGPSNSNAGKLLYHCNEIRLRLSEMDQNKEIPTDLHGNKAYGAYKNLAELVAPFVQERIEASSYVDGKTYYSFVNPSKIGYIVKNLKDVLDTYDPDVNPDVDSQSASKFENYIENNYGRYDGWFKDNGEWLNYWLYLLTEDSKAKDIREIFQHSVELNYIGTEYENLGALGFQLSILHNYFPREGESSEVRRFALPTMSNKKTNEYLRMVTIGTMEMTNDDIKEGEAASRRVNWGIINKVLMPTFKQEINRIADVLFQFSNGNIFTENMDIASSDLIKAGWTENQIEELKDRIDKRTITGKDIISLQPFTSGAKFHFLWYLNDVIKTNERLADDIAYMLNVRLGQKEDNTSVDLKRISDTQAEIKNIIKEKMKSIVSDELKRMRSIGLFEKETIKLPGGREREVFKYQEEFGGRLGKYILDSKDEEKSLRDAEKSMEEALEEFIWQDIAANINIIQLTGGDLAYYGNSVNYQKRIAMIHSPGTHLMSDETTDDGYLRSVHISDHKMKGHLMSELVYNATTALERNLENIPDSQKEDYQTVISIAISTLKDIDTTDGQSLTSITGLRKKLQMQGLWSTELDNAYNAVLSGKYTAKDIAVFTKAPSKPFVPSDVAKYSGSPSMTLRKTPLQDKNSEYLIVLAEALTRRPGSKLAAIFDFMEQTAKENPKAGIDTVHFHSVGKVGVSGVIDISAFDEDFEAMMDAGKVTIEDYNKMLTDYLLEHVRSAKSKMKGRQDPEFLEKQEKTSLNAKELIYNSKYVDTIPVNDYIIQQEVPARFLDEEMLYGSQIRILGISDITPGTQFKVRGESELMDADILVNEYKSLHADNIEHSFNMLMLEFGLSGYVELLRERKVSINTPALKAITDVKQRDSIYKKLESMLQIALSKDVRYGQDLKDSCTLVYDDNGHVIDFAVPLFEGSQSNRIQMLINSIIKTEINKQRINGGPLVQASAYDNRLHIRFNDHDGNPLQTLDEFKEDKIKEWKRQHHGQQLPENFDSFVVDEFKQHLKDNQAGIAYYECYAPVPDARLEKLITKADGTYMSPKEIQDLMPEVWDSLSQMVGYRIPTEDKYSMIPMKIVGFVPKFAGEVLMLPQEITALTGSDFDIDKIYIMRKALDLSLPKLDQNTKQLNNDLVINEVKEFIEETGKSRFPGMESFAKMVMKNIIDYCNGNFQKDTYTGLNSQGIESIQDFAEWYKTKLIKEGFKEYSIKDSTLSPIKSKKARDNRLIDLQWAVLTNEDTVSKLLNPQQFKSLEMMAKIVNIKKEGKEEGNDFQDLKDIYTNKGLKELDKMLSDSDQHNVTLPSSKIYFQGQNMQGAQMVGIFANNNVSHAFCSFRNFAIDLGKFKKSKVFKFNGMTIGDHENPTPIDMQVGRNGQLVSRTIAKFLAASLDTAKNPCLTDLNVNTFTAGVATTLARMGYDEAAITLFLSQPILVRLSELYFIRKTEGAFDGQYAIKEMAKAIGMERTQDNDPMTDIEDIARKDLFTNKTMFAHLTDNMDRKTLEEEKEDQDELEYQRNVLKAFNILYSVSKDMQQLTHCTKYNSITNAVGPTIADTIADTMATEDFFDNIKTSSFYEPQEGSQFDSIRTVIELDPILNAFYRYTHGISGASDLIFNNFFPHYFSGFQNVLKVFKDNYVKNGKITAKLHNQLLNEYMYYLLTYSDETHSPVLPTDKDDLESLIKNLPKEYEAAKAVKGRKFNLILDSEIGTNGLRIRKADSYLSIDTLIFSGSQLDVELQNKLRIAWTELLQSDNDVLHQFGNHLFFYFLTRNGFTFSPKTMMHLATMVIKYNATYKKGFSNYLSGLRQLESLDRMLFAGMIEDNHHTKRYLSQFMRNHAGNKAMVPNLKSTDPIISPDVRNGELVGIELAVDKEEEYKLRKVMLKENIPYHFITVTQKVGSNLIQTLFELDPETDGLLEEDGELVLRYNRTNRLGLVNNFIEYNANSDIQNSFFEDIRTESAESYDEEESYSYDKDKENEQIGSSTQDDAVNPETENKVLLDLRLRNELIKDNSDSNKALRKAIKNIFSAISQQDSKDNELKTAINDLLKADLKTDEGKRSAYNGMMSMVEKADDDIKIGENKLGDSGIRNSILSQIKEILDKQNPC